MSESGYKIKKTALIGGGAVVQILGIVVFLWLISSAPLGTLVALLLGPALFFKGVQMADFWVCSRCGERLPSKEVEICRGCKCTLSPAKPVPTAWVACVTLLCIVGSIASLYVSLPAGRSDASKVSSPESQSVKPAVERSGPVTDVDSVKDVVRLLVTALREVPTSPSDAASSDTAGASSSSLWGGKFHETLDENGVVVDHWIFVFSTDKIRVEYALEEIKDRSPDHWERSVSVEPVEPGSGVHLLFTGEAHSLSSPLYGANWRLSYARSRVKFVEFWLSNRKGDARSFFRSRYKSLLSRSKSKPPRRVHSLKATAPASSGVLAGLPSPIYVDPPSPPDVDFGSLRRHPWLVKWFVPLGSSKKLTKAEFEGGAFFKRKEQAEQFVATLRKSPPVGMEDRWDPWNCHIVDPYLDPDWARAYSHMAVPEWQDDPDRIASVYAPNYVSFRVGGTECRWLVKNFALPNPSYFAKRKEVFKNPEEVARKGEEAKRTIARAHEAALSVLKNDAGIEDLREIPTSGE